MWYVDVEKMEVASGTDAAEAVANMDEIAYKCLGRDVFRFVHRAMLNPELRAQIKKRAAEIRAEEAACTGT